MHYPLASPIHGGGGPRKRWKGLASGDNASYSFLHHSGGSPFGGWRHHLCPCSGGTMGAGHFSQFARGVAAKGKPYNRASPVEMHPFCRLRRRLPRRGRFALHFAYRFISSTEAERRANFPLRGKPREAGIGVHFHRAAGPVGLFSLRPPGRL